MAESWVEPRTRIPLAGIIAMVLVVAVVAIFLKTQLSAIFPDSTVSVTSTAEDPDAANLGGRASATFEGLREVRLVRFDRLQGVLTSAQGTMRFTVDPAGRSLFLVQDGRTEEILLRDAGTSGALTATFEYDGVQTRVDIDGSGRELSFARPGTSDPVIAVALAPMVSYEGSFTFNGDQYSFAWLPASSLARIGTSAGSWDVALTPTDEGFSGVWNDGARTRPITIETDGLLATIAEMW